MKTHKKFILLKPINNPQPHEQQSMTICKFRDKYFKVLLIFSESKKSLLSIMPRNLLQEYPLIAKLKTEKDSKYGNTLKISKPEKHDSIKANSIK